MIWALETYELHDRPTCSECPPHLQERRGCPIHKTTKGYAWRFSSPLLQGKGATLYHCPVGVILTDHPWVYRAIEFAGYAEQMTPPQFAQLSEFAKAVIRLVGSERERLREVKQRQMKAKNASAARLRHG